MKKYIFIVLVLLIVSLSSCSTKLEYECNVVDQTFIPFFGDHNYTIDGVQIGLLNQCNENVDSLDESSKKISVLYDKVSLKNTSIEPDISGIEAYINYYSNTRKYPEDLVSYNIFDSYNGTMELAFVYDGYLQLDVFVEYYDEPMEGELNDFNLTDEFYKMRYYVNDNYLYFVQYHNDDGSQFTVTRVYFTEEEHLLYDHLTYYKEGKSYNYEYTYYQEGVKGVQLKYRYFDQKKGMLDVRIADFATGDIMQFHLSNYINPMYRLQMIDPAKEMIFMYSQELDHYTLNKEIYDSNGFVYGERYDNKFPDKMDYRYNLRHLKNWEHYFQNNLYSNEVLIEDSNSEVFVNTRIKLEDYIDIAQHFEYVYHGNKEGRKLIDTLTFKGLTSKQNTALGSIDNEYIEGIFDEILRSSDLEEVELLDIWAQYIPVEFVEFIEENKRY